MAIFKANVDNNYTVIPNGTAQDSRLSFEARGMLSLLLSLPVDWQVNNSWLVNQSCAGRDKVKKLILELIEHGYMSKQQPRNQKGKFTSNDYFVYATPVDGFAVNGKTVDGLAASGESATTKETSLEKKYKQTLVQPKAKPSKFKFNDDQMRFAEWVFGKVKSVTPSMKSPNLESWANTARLMCDSDNLTLKRMAVVFNWANSDNFWQSNILSMDKFRKQFAQLEAKMPAEKKQSAPVKRPKAFGE